MTDLPALDRYRTQAKRLGKRFRDLSSEQVLQAVATHLPDSPADILDVGAGSGRDATHFARLGHRVTAVEPVREMSDQAKSLPGNEHVEWVTDHLPNLAQLQSRKAAYDLTLLSGVWHHLSDAQRPQALTTLARLTRPGGRLILSLRLGDDADGITNFAIDPKATIALAETLGFRFILQTERPSIQPANIAKGVVWQWLVLERESTP